jgi:hypothetical protein
MFIISQILLHKSNICKHTSIPSYSIAIGIVIYAIIYLYILFSHDEYLELFNNFSVYVISVDLLLSTVYFFNLNKTQSLQSLNADNMSDQTQSILDTINQIDMENINDLDTLSQNTVTESEYDSQSESSVSINSSLVNEIDELANINDIEHVSESEDKEIPEQETEIEKLAENEEVPETEHLVENEELLGIDQFQKGNQLLAHEFINSETVQELIKETDIKSNDNLNLDLNMINSTFEELNKELNQDLFQNKSNQKQNTKKKRGRPSKYVM